jgi:hypothetical protein
MAEANKKRISKRDRIRMTKMTKSEKEGQKEEEVREKGRDKLKVMQTG